MFYYFSYNENLIILLQLEIVCEDLGLKGSFLAIDYIEIGSSNPEDCIQTTTTTLSTTTLTTPNTPEPDTTESTTNTETTEDLTTSETTEPTTLTESTISTTTTDPEITTEDSETTSDDSTGGTSPDTTTLPSGPKPPNNSDEQSQRLMSIIGVCIGSALTIWLIVLTISSINISTIPVVNRAGIKDDVGMTIPRLQVQQIKTDDVGKWVIDISGADSKKE